MKDIYPRDFSNDYTVKKEGDSKEKHIIFPRRETKYVTDNFGKRIHWSHPLVIKQTGLSFLRGDGRDPTSAQEHKIESLQNNHKGKSIAGTVDW